MMTQDIEKLNTSSEITDWAKMNNLLNMADNYTSVPCSGKLMESLVNCYVEFVNVKSPKNGLLDLREGIARKIEKLYQKKYDPETEITITSGAKQAILASVFSLIKEGDEVLIFEPCHKSYDGAITLSGAKPVYVSLKSPNFRVDWEEVHKVINLNTKMIIINSPHYPTGSVFSELDMIRLQKIINGTKIVVLSDETSEHILYDGEMHQSISMYPKLAARGIHVSSFNDSLSVPNWNVGYCAAPASLMKEIRKVTQVMCDGVGLPFQKAISDYLSENNNFQDLSKIYQQKRDLLLSMLENSRFKAIPSKGGYFQVLSYDQISSDRDIDIVKRLIDEHKLAVMPLGFYYHERSKKNMLRFNFSLSEDELIRAVDILEKI